MARYAIGDVQGCFASLQRLLALIDFSPGRDQLWFVGDLVNRGPRSLDMMRWALQHEQHVTVVLGNHDLHFLARAAGASGEKKRDTLDELLAAKDRDRLVDWLRRRSLAHVDGEYVMVHAGIHPQWTVQDTRARAAEIEHELAGPSWRAFLTQLHGSPPRWDARLGGGDRWRSILGYLVRARTLKPDGRLEPDFDGPPSQAPAGCVPWFAFPERAWATHTAVFGHWAALGLDIGPRHVGLDTGCVWGKTLTAMRLDDRSVFQVKAVETSS
ncbi:MAG: symmetrical bis(5'-nucleosyl)-tetraphosphatase [Myxococcota bacterium]|nr:symmetrical bis(5'-nucleosyl)-tetraphosphatase [Deltaproteobacteria bacterium]MDQ3339542.1 symmetrical bis(5'-nucleosyl)-tetraphosphatase [Myxococcota bacterium]